MTSAPNMYLPNMLDTSAANDVGDFLSGLAHAVRDIEAWAFLVLLPYNKILFLETNGDMQMFRP
jgi:hypothetical protein